jgi:hypothetical protein
MCPVEPLRLDLTLELASADGPPSGRIIVAGDAHPFSGWLGLAVALQSAVDEACHETSERVEG